MYMSAQTVLAGRDPESQVNCQTNVNHNWDFLESIFILICIFYLRPITFFADES